MQVLKQRALITLFLGRLARLVAREVEARTPGERALVSKAILSTYRDCRDLGVADEAEQVLGARRPRWYTDA
jgi:hypothetical protein